MDRCKKRVRVVWFRLRCRVLVGEKDEEEGEVEQTG